MTPERHINEGLCALVGRGSWNWRAALCPTIHLVLGFVIVVPRQAGGPTMAAPW